MSSTGEIIEEGSYVHASSVSVPQDVIKGWITRRYLGGFDSNAYLEIIPEQPSNYLRIAIDARYWDIFEADEMGQ